MTNNKPSQTKTDAVIQALTGEKNTSTSGKVRTTVVLSKKIHELAVEEAHEQDMTFTAYVINLIRKDLRSKGYL